MRGFELRPFRLADLAAYRETAVETVARDWFDADGLDRLEQDPYAMTMEIGGVPAASGGLADQGGGLAYAWAALTPIPARHVAAMHRACLARLRDNEFERIETFVKATFLRSLKWCGLLGFEMDRESPTAILGRTIFVRMILTGKTR